MIYVEYCNLSIFYLLIPENWQELILGDPKNIFWQEEMIADLIKNFVRILGKRNCVFFEI